MQDHIFAIREDGRVVWKAVVNGKIIAASWLDRGPALAGMKTEQRRAIQRKEIAPCYTS